MLTTTAATIAAAKTTTTTQRRRNKQQQQKQQQKQKKQRVKQENRQLLLFGIAFLIGIMIYAPIGSSAMPLTESAELSIETKRYCSTNLSDAIRQICGGRYNSLGLKFQSAYSARSLQSLSPEEAAYFRPLITGPIHECCRRPCGYNELKSYCAPIV